MGDRGRSIWASFGNATLRQALTGDYTNFAEGALASTREDLALVNTSGSSLRSWGIGDFQSERVSPTGAANIPRTWGSVACTYFGQPSAV